MRSRWPLGVSVLAIIAVATVGPTATDASITDSVRVMHNGRQIASVDARLYHCHDGAYPEVRCFDSASERDRDGGVAPAAVRVQPHPSSSTTTTAELATFYVTFFQHQDFGGASYTASQSIANLSTFGWNDTVSSFQSLNGGRPKWWDSANWVPPTWQWSAGAWLTYVGSGANDRFSAVANLP